MKWTPSKISVVYYSPHEGHRDECVVEPQNWALINWLNPTK